MSLAEEIIQHVNALPDSAKYEVLHFVQFLSAKLNSGSEENEWSFFSLSSAMRGMEKEESLYTVNDVKEKYR